MQFCKQPGVVPVHPVGVRVEDGSAQLDAVWHGFPDGACHAWALWLTSDNDTLAALWPLLTDNEQTRANAFRVASARNQFVQVRGVLRLLLARCLDIPAAHIGFKYGEFGKPALVQNDPWHFNVAHSGNYALLAIAHGHEVGVDIERLRVTTDLPSLVQMVLSPSEEAGWQALSVDARTHAFFTAWTCKEAVSKAVGQGLRLNFPNLDIERVHYDPHTEMRSMAVGSFGTCRFASLPAPPGYAAALALRD